MAEINGDFKCDKCGKLCEELTSFGAFGNNDFKKKDMGEYCDTCFPLKETEHDISLKNSLEQSEQEEE